ncbi:MAG TPA: hypothetical protein VFW98_00500 [Gemmatimonadaceae bacterium]|nr:hypothetical protein [Gemmatimonadaceae bacterium]
MTRIPRRPSRSLSWPVRLLSAAYGVFALGFGLVVGVAQFSFALRGCRTCWVALPLMLAVAIVGVLCVRVAVRGGR